MEIGYGDHIGKPHHPQNERKVGHHVNWSGLGSSTHASKGHHIGSAAENGQLAIKIHSEEGI